MLHDLLKGSPNGLKVVDDTMHVKFTKHTVSLLKQMPRAMFSKINNMNFRWVK